MTCKFLAHLPLIVVIKTSMSSQKVYIIRTQCSIRVIVIFFGRPPPHLLYYPVRPSTSILLSIALTNVHIAGQISIERYSWKAHLCSRWREPSLSLLPSGPGNIFLLPAPTSPHLHKIGQKPTLCVSPKIASNWSTWLKKCVLQVFDQVGLKDNHGG